MLTLQLELTGIHIVDEFSGNTEWPNKEGRFDLSDFRKESFLKVEGQRTGNASASTLFGGLHSLQSPSTSFASSPNFSGYSPMFR